MILTKNELLALSAAMDELDDVISDIQQAHAHEDRVNDSHRFLDNDLPLLQVVLNDTIDILNILKGE